MQTLQWSFTDKTRWPPGPWQYEPDKVQWVDGHTGLPCLAVRGPAGAWCGYVGLAPDHPAYGIAYNTCRACGDDLWCGHSIADRVSVHGGLTYSGLCQKDATQHGICHVVEEGEQDTVWWVGFDCAHCDDYAPKIDSAALRAFQTYRDLAYVQAECAALADQLLHVARGD